jgi:hypothetical protein
MSNVVTGYPPRILRVVYRSAHHPRRLARVNAKVPYSGIYALSETLARAISQNEILWYRIEKVPTDEIAKIRKGLKRWPEALAESSEQTFVTWE